MQRGSRIRGRSLGRRGRKRGLGNRSRSLKVFKSCSIDGRKGMRISLMEGVTMGGRLEKASGGRS